VFNNSPISNSQIREVTNIASVIINSPVSRTILLNNKGLANMVILNSYNSMGELMASRDLSNLNMAYIDFSGLEVKQINFNGSLLNGAKLVDSKFISCVFKDVDFSNADFSGADFSGSEITDANLKKTTVNETNLSSTKLNNLDFRRAFVTNVNIKNAELVSVSGLGN
jgi:uncharacterized protein YjbI with pentapeptide repeats